MSHSFHLAARISRVSWKEFMVSDEPVVSLRVLGQDSSLMVESWYPGKGASVSGILVHIL